jgi:hypothetical protein
MVIPVVGGRLILIPRYLIINPSEGWPVQYLALLNLLDIYSLTFGKVKGALHKTFRRFLSPSEGTEKKKHQKKIN